MTAKRAVPIVSLAVHLGLGVIPYAASGLIAPPSGLLLLMAVWLAPAIAWPAIVTAGEQLWGWTA